MVDESARKGAHFTGKKKYESDLKILKKFKLEVFCWADDMDGRNLHCTHDFKHNSFFGTTSPEKSSASLNVLPSAQLEGGSRPPAFSKIGKTIPWQNQK